MFIMYVIIIIIYYYVHSTSINYYVPIVTYVTTYIIYRYYVINNKCVYDTDTTVGKIQTDNLWQHV